MKQEKNYETNKQAIQYLQKTIFLTLYHMDAVFSHPEQRAGKDPAKHKCVRSKYTKISSHFSLEHQCDAFGHQNSS